MKYRFIRPAIALISVALITCMAFGIIYLATEDSAAAGVFNRANAARLEVLPDADAFSKMEKAELVDNVTELFSADNGTGYAVTSVINTNGGDITVIVGVDVQGDITGIKVIEDESGNPSDKVLSYSSLYVEALKEQYGSSTRIESMLSQLSANTYSASDVLSACSAATMQVESLGGAF